MAYVITAQGDSILCLEVKVYIEYHGDNKEVHLAMHDREKEYPYHICDIPSSALSLLSSSYGAFLWAAWATFKQISPDIRCSVLQGSASFYRKATCK